MNKQRIQYLIINLPIVLFVVLKMVHCRTPEQQIETPLIDGFILTDNGIELYSDYQVWL